MAWKEIYFVLRIYVVLFDLTVLGSAVPAMPSSISPFQYYAKMRSHGFASFLTIVHHKHHHHHHNARNRSGTSAPRPAYLLHPPMYGPEGMSPTRTASPYNPVSLPGSCSSTELAPMGISRAPNSSPARHPVSSPRSHGSPMLSTLPLANTDCTSTVCTDPMTYSISGYPCACVWPIQIRLRIGVSLYTFFPLATELAAEIATSLSLNQSQVRIMGADAASQQQEETYALMNLVPTNGKFDKNTALSIYEKFWDSQVLLNSSIFGAYEVIYVTYPGLPPSPPSSLSSDGTIASNPYPSNGNHGSLPKPIGVDIPRSQKKGISRSLLLVIILSSFTTFTIFMGIAWLLILKYKRSARHKEEAAPSIMLPVSMPSGATRSLCIGSTAGTTSMSLISSIPTLTGSAKIFSLSEIEKATNSFNATRVLGEGGFGVVYSGILDDETKVAVKVLKRDDHQGGCEFLAEVKMLCRLHHRNLVKLIGICAEDHIRCLVYELVPNGSVESHLHGADKEVAPLDWGARMKISLGAARGLAYLHEDSSPPVIHRDFKSSNILLECDFTPKVSDFGLARAAVNDGSALTLTQVMGTFGYVAPEYAMTGQLLVKSDVYSYGVVLLELLTGRKPVDLSQKPGEENLVAWARPLLSSNEGIESLIDPALKPTVHLESFSKVAAIASMCVEPEVCRRPFMGEVVQALKLVCNEFDDKEEGSRSFHRTDISIDIDSKVSENSLDLEEFSPTHHPVLGYESTPETTAAAFLASDLVSTSAGFREDEFASFRRPFNSGPLRLGKKRNFWQRLRGISRGSASEHGFSYSQFPGSR